MKGFRGTLIFTVVVVALGAYSYYGVFKKQDAEKDKKDKDAQMIKMPKEDISRIDITNGDEFIEIDKKGTSWQLVKPIEDKADTAAVDSFLSSILREKTTTTVDENPTPEALKTYGLDKPAYKAKVWSNQGAGEEVFFGSVKAYDNSLYTQFFMQKPVYLVSSYTESVLKKKADDFRSKNIFLGISAAVDELNISGHDKIDLVKHEDKWQLRDPKVSPELPVSSDHVKTYLDQLANMKGLEFKEGSKTDKAVLKKYFLDKPLLTVHARRTVEPATFDLKVSAPKEKGETNFFMTSNDAQAVMTTNRPGYDALNKDLMSFLDRAAPFEFKTVDAAAVSIKTTQLEAEIKKDTDKWVNADTASKKEVDSQRLSDFLGRLAKLEVTAVVKNKPNWASGAKNRIQVMDAKGELMLDVVWSAGFDDKKDKDNKAAQKMVYVHTNKSKADFTMISTMVDTLPLKDILKDKAPPAAQALATGAAAAAKPEEKKKN